MSHEHHPSLPGYHENQLLVDGCPECEQRGKDVARAISMLDTERFPRAWQRAIVKQRHGLEDVSSAEVPMLDAIGAVAAQLERAGLSQTEVLEYLR